MSEFEYRKKTDKQLRNWFSNKKSSIPNEMGFKDFGEFKDWYDRQKKVCSYCGLTEEESQEIVHKGLLTSNRFPLEGKTSQGVNRGYGLEVDRKNPKGKYSNENCELSCYFCNNDKSDVFNEEQYREFIKDRTGFMKKLLKK
jgi:hypothetical protein